MYKIKYVFISHVLCFYFILAVPDVIDMDNTSV